MKIRKQRGFALILMIMVVTMGVAWYALGAIGKAVPQSYERDQVTAQSLKKAKEALLAYVAATAAMTTDAVDSRHLNPGRLPCPERLSDPGTSNEGKAADLIAGYACNNVGRLPWKSLGVDLIRDGYGEPLWYAVPLNTWAKTTTATTLTINAGLANALPYDGTATSVVAVIIAPGPAINTTPESGTPSGTCLGFATVNQLSATRNTAPLVASNFLECGNATGANYTTIGTSPWSNDRTISITANEVMDAIAGAVADRLQRQVAPALHDWWNTQSAASWGTAFMPYATTFSNPSLNPALCGTFGTREGFTPVSSSPTCNTNWTSAVVSVVLNLMSFGCAMGPTYAECYLVNWFGSAPFSATITATAPNVSNSLRRGITSADISFPDYGCGAANSGSVSGSPTNTVSSATGNGTTVLTVTWPATLGLCLAAVRISFLQNATVLSDARMTWFVNNEWSRYTYYAIAQGARLGAPSLCSGTADPDCLTVSGLPAANGNTDDKRFVLTLMGRKVGAQTQPSNLVTDYLESHTVGTSTFTSATVTSTYNDRQATCPFKVTFADATTSVLCN